MKKQNPISKESATIEHLKSQLSIYKRLIKIAGDEKAAAEQIKANNIDLLAQLETMKNNLISMKGEIKTYQWVIQHCNKQRQSKVVSKDLDENEWWVMPKDKRSFLEKSIDEMTNDEIDLLISYRLQERKD
jgi:hypothetical protein